MEDVRSTKKGCSTRPPPPGPGLELMLGMAMRACTAAATRAVSRVVAHPPVDELADDVTEIATREGEGKARGTHVLVVIGLKVLRDKLLCHGLAHGHVAPELDPDVANAAIGPLVDGVVPLMLVAVVCWGPRSKHCLMMVA